MWIAKPINTISQQEHFIWKAIESKLPLSQSVGWAKAIETLGGRAYLIFSTDEQVGGMIFTNNRNGKLHFECINGPLLDWDHPEKAPRQLATFALAVSKLDRNFGGLIIKPRWESSQMEARVRLLPIPVFKTTHAATIVVPIQDQESSQFTSFSPRLQRTLKITQKNLTQTLCEKVTESSLSTFVPGMQAFGAQQGFTVPPLSWFTTLAKEIDLWLIQSSIKSYSQSQILIGRHGEKVHYLFGYESRSEKLRSAVSTSAIAQWEAIKKCSALGIDQYDLNGYVIDADSKHPYYGVCQFKEQFSGLIVKYDIPEFLIQ